MPNSSKDQQELIEKTEHNELRARDAEARLRIINAEIAIIEQRKKLAKARS